MRLKKQKFFVVSFSIIAVLFLGGITSYATPYEPSKTKYTKKTVSTGRIERISNKLGISVVH